MPRPRRRADPAPPDDDLIGGPGIGHNGPPVPIDTGDSADQFASDQLLAFVERLEDVNERRAELAEESKDILAEAKAAGFDTVQLRKIIALRKLEREEREAQQATFTLYAEALGLL